MSESASSPPVCPILRLVVFHLNFAEKCTNGKELGEGASLEELYEQILFYNRDRRLRDQLKDMTSRNINSDFSFDQELSKDTMEEAVQFVGLCTALFSLPSSLHDDSSFCVQTCENATREVHFDESSLIFVPLETATTTDILAVAQVSRLYLCGSRSDIGGGNPLAVRSSIQKCHKLFCLFRGGGIIRRLQSGCVPQDEYAGHVGSYPHMCKLFQMRKELRRLQNEAIRSPISKHAEMKSSITELSEQISAFAETLPLHKLRKDLNSHYKQYLGDLAVVASRMGGASRCLVETIPAPIPLSSGQHVVKCTRPQPSTEIGINIGLMMRRILDDTSKPSCKNLGILGITTFLAGQLLYTHLSPEHFQSRTTELDESVTSIEIENETSYLVMEYMASHRSKMDQRLASPNMNTTPQRPPQHRLGFKKLILSFGSITDEAPQGFTVPHDDIIESDSDSAGRFLAPPPLFMLNESDCVHVFQGPNNSTVWAPLVHLPFFVKSDGKTITAKVHAILFELFDFSFLIYLVAKSETESTMGSPLPSLEPLAWKLSDAVFFATEICDTAEYGDVSTDAQWSEIRQLQWNEPGLDIIVVNRIRNQLTLFSDRRHVTKSKPSTKHKTPGKGAKQRFLGIVSNKAGAKESGNSPLRQSQYSDSAWSALGLDCRHRLASHLSLDVLLAFDDMMNEVRNIQEGRQNAAASGRARYPRPPMTGNCVELCTSMPQGWIYAHADLEHEMYAFFDKSIHVTVADVQNAAAQARKQLFGEWSL